MRNARLRQGYGGQPSPALMSEGWCGRGDSCPKTEARSADGRAPEDGLTCRASVSECWCGRGDSNPHGIATASPSSWLICCADAN